MHDEQRTDTGTLCECGHTAVQHWHGPKRDGQIIGGIFDCSHCRCRSFVAKDVTPLAMRQAPTGETNDR